MEEYYKICFILNIIRWNDNTNNLVQNVFMEYTFQFINILSFITFDEVSYLYRFGNL